jgi:hypothetical protein
LLCGDLLIFKSVDRETSGGTFLRAVDKRTGRTVWVTPVDHVDYTMPRLMRLKTPDGKALDVVVHPYADKQGEIGMPVIRVADGKILTRFPYHKPGRGAIAAVVGDMIAWSSTHDSGQFEQAAYRLRPTSRDAIAFERVFVFPGRAGPLGSKADFPTMFGRLWLSARTQEFVDITTGKVVGKLPDRLRIDFHGGPVVAGHYLVALVSAGGNGSSRRRPDKKAMSRFVVIDIADPAQPRVVSDRSLLGYAAPARDRIIGKYLGEFDPFVFSGCYKGTPGYFEQMGGPVPHGDRLYLRTSAFLYCVGSTHR